MAARISSFTDLGEHNSVDSSVADFKPGPTRLRPTGPEIDGTSMFPLRGPREPTPSPAEGGQIADGGRIVNVPQTVSRQPRLYRTGRNATISIRASADTIERFYAMADRLGVKNAEAFEQAIQAMMERLDKLDGKTK